MPEIQFRFEQEGLPDLLIPNAPVGETLLEIALQQGVYLKHDCGGVCTCASCHVYIERGNELLEEVSRREEHFLTLVSGYRSISRLSCQALLNGPTGEVHVIVPHQGNDHKIN